MKAGTIFNVLLLVAAAYFYSTNDGLEVFLCVALFLYRVMIASRLANARSLMSRLWDIPHEHNCNVALECFFRIDQALSHSAVDALFQKLSSRGKLSTDDITVWKKQLLENYRRVYPPRAGVIKPETPVSSIRYNIKNNLLFRDGQIDFNDAIYHSVTIPYEYKDGEDFSRDIFRPFVEQALELRLLLVNGILKLQLGEFDKEYSPHILGEQRACQTYVTLTSFPLLYFSYEHGLPVRYLNLSMEATESYKTWHFERLHRSRARFWKRVPDWLEDWRHLNRELEAYRILCDDNDSDTRHYDYDTVGKLSEAFIAKRRTLLEAEQFTNPFDGHEDDGDLPDTGHLYANRYLTVRFQNMNLRREYAPRHWWTDYSEE